MKNRGNTEEPHNRADTGKKNGIKYLIVAAGNILLSDEGIGVHVLRSLAKDKDFHDAAFIDIGTSSLDIGIHLEPEVEKIIILDSIMAEGFEPGTVFRLSIDDLRRRQSQNFSLHQLELVDSLKMLSILHDLPDTVIIGIVPKDIKNLSMELSEEMSEKFGGIVAKVKKEAMDFFYGNA